MKKKNISYESFFLYSLLCTSLFLETSWAGAKRQALLPPAPEQPLTQTEKPLQPESLPTTAFLAPQPPSLPGVEFYHMSYDKAEEEVLALFSKDVPLVEQRTQNTAVFQVITTGFQSQSQQSKIKDRLERVISTSTKIAVKNCIACSQSKLIRTQTGELEYQSFTTNPKEVSTLATNLGVDTFLYAEMHYRPDEVALRIKLVEPKTQAIQWSKEYSTEQIAKYEGKPKLHDDGFGTINQDDAMAQFLAGESRFFFSPNLTVGWIPTIAQPGKKETQLEGPGVGFDFLFGERFGLNKNVFAFLVGGTYTPPSAHIKKGKPLGGGIKLGLHYKRFLNPYSYKVPRFTFNIETGALTMIHFFIPYASLGFEMFMIRRFSFSFMPVYYLPTPIKSSVLGEGRYGNNLGFQTRIGLNF